MEEGVKAFYDEFSKRLLADYVHGNPRIEAAIEHSLRWIPTDAKRILDLGCGIGWSTWEIKRNHRGAFVLGGDLSSKAIQLAQKLFDGTQLAFATHDITEWGSLLEPPFDAIVMLDLYEHIPRPLRGKVHQVLDKTLGSDGIVILTCPSLSHQQFLRTYQPHGLQPIDEDVTVEDVSKLADDINGRVIHCDYVSIWHPSDYIHVVVKRKSDLAQKDRHNNEIFMALEQQHVRAHRVESRLKVRVTRDGLLLPERKGAKVCIISPNKNAYSETFVRAHIEKLPATVKLLYGGWFPTHTEDDRPLLPSDLIHQAIRYAWYKVAGSSPQHFRDKALTRFLQTNRVNVVLAEYGPTGVSVMEPCLAAGVPFVVHFHGFDAYDQETLRQNDSAYKRMFAAASALIAVSCDMERQLLALGVPRRKLFYNPCGVDTALFSGAAPETAPPVLVAVGRFVDKKAPHLTLLAFGKVTEVCPDARLKMIGDGELLESCKQLARALGICHAVEFLGPRPHPEVAATMRHARAFVQHSVRATYGDSEGTPVAILEAGAAGLPVVATRHAGIQDVIVDGKTGLLVDEGDVDRMACCMIQLVEDPELAGRLGKAARERIVAQFSLEKSISGLWSIVEAAIQRNGRRSTA